jgi:hypothetical protein
MVGHGHSTPETPDVQASIGTPDAEVYLVHTITRTETVNIYGKPDDCTTNTMRVGDETVTAEYGTVYPRYVVRALVTAWIICDNKTGNVYANRVLNREFVQRALDGVNPDFTVEAIAPKR